MSKVNKNLKIKPHFLGKDAVYFDVSQSVSHFPVGLYFNKVHGVSPCVLDLGHRMTGELITFLQKNGELIYEYNSVPSSAPASAVYEFDDYFDENERVSNMLYVYKDIVVFVTRAHGRKIKQEEVNYEITIYYKPGEKSRVEEFEKFFIEEKHKNTIYTILRDEHGSVRFEPFEVPMPENYCIEQSYEPRFKDIHNKIVENLNKNESGLYLFHGDPGTGKTTYIKHLSSLIKREFIYVPTSFLDHLSDPSFLPALLHKKQAVLVIEDAEKALLAREPGDGGAASLVSTILNLTDGIMANVFNISIIATYNSPRQSIDKALLRKGRLKAEYRFDKLSIEQAQKIVNTIKKDYKVTEPMALADIYNLDDEDFIITKELVEEKRMGFR
jgi:energy-coupling factor transporter ATP-binding protein EcfA2